MRRARAIANALVADGIDVGRIGTVKSLGEHDLLINVSTRERANRRAVVTLDDMLAACRTYRQISLSASSMGPSLQNDLQQRLATAVAAYSQFTASGANPAAYQMAGAAREDCNMAVNLGANEVRKVEFAQKCLCNSARLDVALN
jgi:hypothetical protein